MSDYSHLSDIVPRNLAGNTGSCGVGVDSAPGQQVTVQLSERGLADTLVSWDEVKLLDVRLNRLPRWYTDGLLCIGDAAHAMSRQTGQDIQPPAAVAAVAGRLPGLSVIPAYLVGVGLRPEHAPAFARR